MSNQHFEKVSRRWLAAFLLPAMLVTSFLISPQQASSSTPLTLPVMIEDFDGEPLENITLEVCHEGTVEWVCQDSQPSNSDGQVTVSISSLPNDTGFVHLGAGGYPTDYSRTGRGVSFRSGVPDDSQPTIILVETEWITASIAVTNELSQAVRGEYVQLSTQVEGMGDPWTMMDWAQTDDDGIAVFKLDPLLWRTGNQNVTARIGVGGFGSHLPAETTFVITGLLANETISTTSLSYSLSGVVTDDLDNLMINTDLCLWYTNQTTRKNVEIDFRTDNVGAYLIEGVKERHANFKPQACGSFDEDLTFDHDIGYEVTVTESAATLDPQFTKTGISLTVIDDLGAPAPFVQVGLEPAPFGEHDYRRQAMTNQLGVAYFSGLQPNTDYEVSYKHSDRPWETQRYLDNTKTELVPTLERNTIVVLDDPGERLTLTRVGDFETPVTVKGRLLGVSDYPIANGIVQIDAHFGINGSKYIQFRARTNNLGVYEVSGLPEGRISLSVSAKGYRAVRTDFETSAEESLANLGVYNQGDFRLRPTVEGELQYAGVLRNTSGQPIADMELILNKPFEDGGGQQKATTDAQGKFSFKGLNAGHHWLYANSSWEEYEWSHWGFNLTTNKLNASLVMVGRGMTNPGLQASISGRVFEYKDIEGPSAAVPIEGYCVDVFPVEGGTVTRGETDADGNWIASGLVDGERYFIGQPNPCVIVEGAEDRFDFENQYEFPQASSNIVTARVSGGTAHQWVYKEVSRSGSGSISGRVRDGEDYSNLAGVVINIERANGGIILDPAITDSRGEYQFSNLPAGDYYLSIGDPFIGDSEYWDSWMSVEVATEANRANILLWKKAASGGDSEGDSEELDAWNGVVSGTVLDENGKPHGSAEVSVFDATESYVLGFGFTDNEGNFDISNLPTGTSLFLKIIPWWTEIAMAFVDFVIDGSASAELGEIELDPGTSISGEVLNIPQGVEVRQIFAELVNATTGTFIHSSPVDSKTGQYVIGQVPDGEYKIRFTQNSFGGYWSEYVQNSVSMKPVYWDNSQFGTTNLSLATTISVTGAPIITRNVTYSEGSSLQGAVSIDSVDGPIPLSGSRSLWVDLFRKNASGNFTYTTSAELSARSSYSFQFVGLAEGEYKVAFTDSRTGSNSLTSNFNGGAFSLEDAPPIVVGEAEVKVVSQVMEVAPPQTSAEAFDLASLSAEILQELKDDITLTGSPNPGSEIDIFVGTEFSGEFVSAFANSTPVVLGDWQQVNSDGYITVSLPTTLPAGNHRVGVQDSRSVVFGWAPMRVGGSQSGSGEPTAPPLTAATPVPQLSNSKDDVIAQGPNEEVAEEDSKEGAESSMEQGETDQPSNNQLALPLFGALVLVGLVSAIWLLRSKRGLHSRK